LNICQAEPVGCQALDATNGDNITIIIGGNETGNVSPEPPIVIPPENETGGGGEQPQPEPPANETGTGGNATGPPPEVSNPICLPDSNQCINPSPENPIEIPPNVTVTNPICDEHNICISPTPEHPIVIPDPEGPQVSLPICLGNGDCITATPDNPIEIPPENATGGVITNPICDENNVCITPTPEHPIVFPPPENATLPAPEPAPPVTNETAGAGNSEEGFQPE